jgi:hypothetical protein
VRGRGRARSTATAIKTLTNAFARLGYVQSRLEQLDFCAMNVTTDDPILILGATGRSGAATGVWGAA